jgi:hypothetical protein
MCCVAHIHRQGARSNKETYFPPQKAPRRVSFQDAKGMLLSFSMLAIQFPSDKFETRDITAAAACISH